MLYLLFILLASMASMTFSAYNQRQPDFLGRATTAFGGRTPSHSQWTGGGGPSAPPERPTTAMGDVEAMRNALPAMSSTSRLPFRKVSTFPDVTPPKPPASNRRASHSRHPLISQSKAKSDRIRSPSVSTTNTHIVSGKIEQETSTMERIETHIAKCNLNNYEAELRAHEAAYNVLKSKWQLPDFEPYRPPNVPPTFRWSHRFGDYLQMPKKSTVLPNHYGKVVPGAVLFFRLFEGCKVALKCVAIDDRLYTTFLLTEMTTLFAPSVRELPNVITAYDAFVDADVPYMNDGNRRMPHLCLVLEYMDGGSLYDLIRKKGRLTESYSRSVMWELLKALDGLHRAGFIHRDVKPENIMFQTTGDVHGQRRSVVKLIDAGLAIRRAAGDKMLPSDAGTHGYLPWEAIMNKLVNSSVDYFGAGVVGHEMMLGPITSRRLDEGMPDDLFSETAHYVVKATSELKKLRHAIDITDAGKRTIATLLSDAPGQRASALKSVWFVDDIFRAERQTLDDALRLKWEQRQREDYPERYD